jgi:hypothetical protein
MSWHLYQPILLPMTSKAIGQPLWVADLAVDELFGYNTSFFLEISATPRLETPELVLSFFFPPLLVPVKFVTILLPLFRQNPINYDKPQ